MMDPADSVFVGLLALLYSTLSSVYWSMDPGPTDPYRFLETAPHAAGFAPAQVTGCPVELTLSAPARGGARLGETVILGSVPQQQVTDWFSAHLQGLAWCGEGTPGRVVLKLAINRDGEVLHASVVRSDDGLAGVAACAASVLAAEAFMPAPALFMVRQELVFGE